MEREGSMQGWDGKWVRDQEWWGQRLGSSKETERVVPETPQMYG